MSSKYSVKNEYIDSDVIINPKKLKGLKVKPKNDIKYDTGKIEEVILIDDKIIDNVLKKKIKNKLNNYLEYVMSIVEDDDTSGTTIREAKDDLARYKSIIKHKYKKYLEPRYIELLIKKIELLEYELNTKIIVKDNQLEEEYEKGGKKR